ncbi:hypothetical protein F8388_008685 [Cannabis sativa]|uniref:CCHC-type domain-containing protein n=1 Tax=Cannabis sativa TaxID=3483 RepID=A0A7J6HK21_CANSA|nr:hypothetical protein F8388_008685 [Cannabis sativa]
MDLELVNRLSEVLVLDEGDGPVLPLNKVGIAEELFAREWGERIGKLEDIKIVNGTMKVRVRINITEPLKRGLRVAIDDNGNEVSLLFQYEHLPDFCYDCGIIGHKALDCPLRDFGGDNPRIDNGRFGSWLCAPASPPRDNFRFNRKRADSPSSRPIMTMGEASRIISAVERSRPRYSGPTPEQLAPTSVLEAREREEEEKSAAGVDPGINGDMDDMGEVNKVDMVGGGVHCVMGEVNKDNNMVRESELAEMMDGVASHSVNELLKVMLFNKLLNPLSKHKKLRLGSALIRQRVVVLKVLNGDFLHSDHRPIVATLENVTRRRHFDKKRGFRFETHWLKDPECQEIVNKSWLSTASPLAHQDSLIDIFGSCANQLGEWNKGRRGYW